MNSEHISRSISQLTAQNTSTQSFHSTGIVGLDEILCGGLTGDRPYLLEGAPGSGKTTLALQFLLEGVRRGEAALHITLSETAVELQAVAAALAHAGTAPPQLC
jgi:circadian clock protein KaiC